MILLYCYEQLCQISIYTPSVYEELEVKEHNFRLVADKLAMPLTILRTTYFLYIN